MATNSLAIPVAKSYCSHIMHLEFGVSFLLDSTLYWYMLRLPIDRAHVANVMMPNANGRSRISFEMYLIPNCMITGKSLNDISNQAFCFQSVAF